jgi:glycosyltransferase involved in cell wall biosynthesis
LEGKVCRLLHRHHGNGARSGNHHRRCCPIAGNTNPEIVFLMLGEGAEKERIARAGARARSEQSALCRSAASRKIPAYICASDVCLVLLKKNRCLFKTVIPTKMLEFMSCARPVILGVDGQARILEEARGGLVIEPENPNALVNAIRYLAANREEGAFWERTAGNTSCASFPASHTAENTFTCSNAC